MEAPSLIHPLGSVVFAKCQKFKPWPAEVKEVFLAPSPLSGLSEHIYNVKFIGSNSYSDHRISDLETFNQRTYNKYRQIYHNSSNKEEQQILKSMTLAWKKHQQHKKRQLGGTTSPKPVVVVKETIPKRKTSKRNSP